ncbi:MAG: hypothetical protein MJZ77_00255 [Bacteroidales bacterium]|nr:hypothetical protein [Bacteroidales bacterium]
MKDLLYRVTVKRVKTAVIFVAADSYEDAEKKVLDDIQCIDDSDFIDENEASCEYQWAIYDLDDEQVMYDEKLERMTVADYMQQVQDEEAILQEGGAE